MKNITLLVLSLFLLSGCVSIDTPKMPEKSRISTSDLVGIWTLKLAISESSFQINSDNSGKYCMSLLNTNSVNSFKIADNVITLNDGSKFKIMNFDQDKIIVRPLRTIKENKDLKYISENYFDGKYLKDNNLNLASEYCKKVFTQ